MVWLVYKWDGAKFVCIGRQTVIGGTAEAAFYIAAMHWKDIPMGLLAVEPAFTAH